MLAGIPAKYYDELDDDFHRQFYTIGEVAVSDVLLPRIKIEEW